MAGTYYTFRHNNVSRNSLGGVCSNAETALNLLLNHFAYRKAVNAVSSVSAERVGAKIHFNKPIPHFDTLIAHFGKFKSRSRPSYLGNRNCRIFALLGFICKNPLHHCSLRIVLHTPVIFVTRNRHSVCRTQKTHGFPTGFYQW